MKVIVAGSRDIKKFSTVEEAIKLAKFNITEVVSGGAYGVDRLGERWAKDNNIPLKVFMADWIRFSNRAGILRNIQMAEYGEALIAVWDGCSTGTKHMIDIATKKGLKVYIHEVNT